MSAPVPIPGAPTSPPATPGQLVPETSVDVKPLPSATNDQSISAVDSPPVQDTLMADAVPPVPLTRRRYCATLVLVSTNAVSLWKDELCQHFPVLEPRFWFGHEGQGDHYTKTRTLGNSVGSLEKYLLGLPDTPSTLLRVVTSTYRTFSTRVVRTINSDKGKAAESKKSAEAGADGPPEDEDAQAEVGVDYEMLCTGLFGCVVADEAQRLKHTKTHAHISVRDLAAPYINFLTATPTMNKPADLEDLLALIWKGHWARASDEQADPPPEDYKTAQEVLVGRALGPAELHAYAWILDPTAFRRHGAPNRFTSIYFLFTSMYLDSSLSSLPCC